jgi:hypothetical protein
VWLRARRHTAGEARSAAGDGAWALVVLGPTGSRSIVRTWRDFPASVRTTADGMTPPVTSFSMTAISPA